MDVFGLIWIAIAAAWGWMQWPYSSNPSRLVLILMLLWFAGAVLISIPYVRRWGAGIRDAIWISAILWLAVSLPAVSLWSGPSKSLYPFAFGPLYAAFLFLVFRNQGRYAHSKRDLPDLEGEPREAAEAILRKAGLTPVAMRVTPLQTFNGAVAGLRKCILLLDRRASVELTIPDLSALVAHEAGHLKRGDVYLHLLIAPLALLCGLEAEERTGLRMSFLPVFICLYAGAGMALRQFAELRADRFAAKLTAPGDVGSMLRRVHGDMPLSVGRTARAPLFAPFLTHPPLDVRLKALGIPSRGGGRWYGATMAAQLLLSSLPFVISLANPSAPPALVWGPAGVVFILFFWAFGSLIVRARRSFGIAMSGPTRAGLSKPLVLILAVAAATLTALLAVGVDSPLFMAWVILSALVIFCALSIFLWRRFAGAGLATLPGPLRTALVEALAAAHEGKPEQALERLVSVPTNHYRHPWFRAVQGECLMLAGRLEEAACSLEAASERDPRFTLPKFDLSMVLLLQGDADRARKLIEEVCAFEMDDPLAWRIRAQIGLHKGDIVDARKSIDRACALKPEDAAALGIAALVAMDEGGYERDVAAKVAEAERAGPQSPQVLLARSRWLARLGQMDESMKALEESCGRLAKLGLKVWIGYYQSLARKWGIGPAEPAKVR